MLALRLGSLFTGFGVAFGALGAHALSNRLDSKALAQFQTGTHYQLIHGLALLVLGLMQLHFEARKNTSTPYSGATPNSHLLGHATLAFSVGITLFSGSLFAYSLTQWLPLVWFTPIGGIAFLVGWLQLTRFSFQLKSRKN